MILRKYLGLRQEMILTLSPLSVQNGISLFEGEKKLSNFQISYLCNQQRFCCRTKFRINFDDKSINFSQKATHVAKKQHLLLYRPSSWKLRLKNYALLMCALRGFFGSGWNKDIVPEISKYYWYLNRDFRFFRYNV